MFCRIFLTVGTQAPFDRLVRLIDSWIEVQNNVEVFGQIGAYKYKPKNFRFVEELNELDFNKFFESATLIISHAGMGTIINSCQKNKPIIVLPRLMKNKEHRNDHQLTTVRGLSKAGYIYPCYDENDLLTLLSNVNQIKVLKRISNEPEGELFDFIEKTLSNLLVSFK